MKVPSPNGVGGSQFQLYEVTCHQFWQRVGRSKRNSENFIARLLTHLGNKKSEMIVYAQLPGGGEKNRGVTVGGAEINDCEYTVS